jgi:hypothetical protein
MAPHAQAGTTSCTTFVCMDVLWEVCFSSPSRLTQIVWRQEFGAKTMAAETEPPPAGAEQATDTSSSAVVGWDDEVVAPPSCGICVDPSIPLPTVC